jgi:hypothetical protein
VIIVMMRYGSEMVFIRIDGNKILFGDTSQGAQITPIENLRLSKSGVEKEFPDLVGNINWRNEAIKRFKEHLATFQTEQHKADYVIEDLKKHGYTPYAIQIAGRRPTRL